MDPAAKKVEDSYDALEGLVGDYKSAIMDANEQLDANQQQQLDEMRTDLDRILEYLGLE